MTKEEKIKAPFNDSGLPLCTKCNEYCYQCTQKKIKKTFSKQFCKKYPVRVRCAHCGFGPLLDRGNVWLHLIRKHPFLTRTFLMENFRDNFPISLKYEKKKKKT